MRDCELADEAYEGDGETAHDERCALLDVVRPKGDDERGGHAEDVDGNGQQLCVACGVAHFLEHGGDGGCEAVGTGAACPEWDDG